VRRELDGFYSTAENVAGRLKRTKLAPESEFKDQVSRALVKTIYQNRHGFFRPGRDQSKRLFFQQIGSITCDETRVNVEIENCCTFSVITDVDQTNPLSSARKSPDGDEKNAVLSSNFKRERKEMRIAIEYNISVTVEDKVETMCLVRKISNFNSALNFGIALIDRLGFPGKKQLPPFSDPSKSEGWRGLYSLSVYGRSEKKEGFLS
jgi:hypothetical protein